MKAWHFVGDTLRDGRPVPKDGEWLVHDGPVEMCAYGLHASTQPFDALTYAPGNTLCLVECEDIAETKKDKFVCRRRKIIARMNTEEMLRYFARMQALSVVHLWDAPDVVLDYLMTGDESLRFAAWDCTAARATTQLAAWDVGRDVARQDFNNLVYECFEDWL